MNNQTGLRERKKAETRSALSLAAMRLAIEHGLAEVTADEIAAAANVSVRTFHNYFASKEDAIAEAFRAVFAVYADELRERPAGEPILDALEHVLVHVISGRPDEPSEMLRQLHLLAADPGNPAFRIAFEEVERRFVEAVAWRTGTDAVTDVYPHVVTAVAGAAARIALEASRTGGSSDPAGLLHEAFALLRAGLPEPRK